MWEAALRYPTNGERAVERIRIRGVLALPVVLAAIAVAYVVMAAPSDFAVVGRLGAAFDLGAVGW